MLGQSSCPTQALFSHPHLIPSSSPHRMVQGMRNGGLWPVHDIPSVVLPPPCMFPAPAELLHKPESQQENLLLLLPGLSLGCTSSRTPNTCSTRLLANLPQAAGGRCALTPGELPSPHLSLPRVVFCSFSPQILSAVQW